MFTDDELLPISALQHLVFCPRRAALVHLEGIWLDNRYTAEGRILHGRAHDPRRGESRPGVRITRGLQLRSYQLGLCGTADVVELHDRPGNQPPRIVIVEYKRGRPKPDRNEEYRVQLCAQALCLEEMLGANIPAAALYFGRARRRTEVPLDAALREKTIAAARALRELINSRVTPRAQMAKKCKFCSLADHCLPRVTGAPGAAEYLRKQLDRHLAEPGPETDP